MNEWQCPNCGKPNQTKLAEKRICTRCGWSDEEPPGEPRGYE